MFWMGAIECPSPGFHSQVTLALLECPCCQSPSPDQCKGCAGEDTQHKNTCLNLEQEKGSAWLLQSQCFFMFVVLT